MLRLAKHLALAGRAVYVIADNTEHARKLESVCFKNGEPNLGIKFETPSSLGTFDWKTMRLRGAHSNCVVLVDHYAIENRFSLMFEMLHAFDLPNDK